MLASLEDSTSPRPKGPKHPGHFSWTHVNYLVYSLDHILIVLPFSYYTLIIVGCKLDTICGLISTWIHNNFVSSHVGY